MKKSLLLFCLFIVGSLYKAEAQVACSTCSNVATYVATMTASPSMVYTVNASPSGQCCQGAGSDKCVVFNVTVHPQTTQVAFYYSTGNSGGYYINCTDGPYTANSNVCLGSSVGTNFCITYCKAGHGQTFTITTSSGFSAVTILQPKRKLNQIS